MQPIEIIGIIIEIQFSCQLQKIWASGQRKTLGPTKKRLKNGETSVKFIDLLIEVSGMWNVNVAAYCLMTNHYHILLQTPDANISTCMRHLNSVYTQRYNRIHGFDGQLFRLMVCIYGEIDGRILSWIVFEIFSSNSKGFSIPTISLLLSSTPRINSPPAPFAKAIIDFNHFALGGRDLFNSNLRFSGCLTLSGIFIFPHTEYSFSHFLTVRIRRFVSKAPNSGYVIDCFASY